MSSSLFECPSLEDEDSSIENAWPGIVTTLILYGAICLCLVVVFECCRRANPMVYAPRSEITPDRKLPPLPLGCCNWIGTMFQIEDEETLRVAGMDAYTLIHFLRMNLMLSSFCFVFTFVILVPIYGTSSQEEDNSFSKLTMDNLRPNSGRLWACWVAAYVITGVVIYLADVEWRNHIIKRREFYCHGDSSIPGGQQFLYTVIVELLPKELRSEFKLSEYFNAQVFPAPAEGSEVISCFVTLKELSKLKKLIDKSEKTVINLETSIAQRNVLHQDKQSKKNAQNEDKKAEMSWGCSCLAAADDDNGDDSKVEPRTSYCCVCLPGLGQLVEDDEEGLVTGTICCSKTVDSVPHFRKMLDAENEKVETMQKYILGQSDDVESSARAGTSIAKSTKSGLAFVTLRSRQAASDASQVLLSNDPSSVEITQAPDPRDIIWKNTTGDLKSLRRRQYVVSLCVKFFALFLFIPLLVLCNLFGDIERLSKIPGLTVLQELDPDSFAYTFITTQVPPLLQSIIVGLLPAIFTWVAIDVEGVKQYSAVQRSVVDRAFGYQLVNVYFTLLGASLGSTMQTIIEDPACIFALLGSAIPAVAGYFTQIVLINGLMGMGMELSRVVPLIMANLLSYLDKKGASIRKLQERHIVSISPGELYPGLLLITMLGLTYAIIVPFMSCCTTLFFLLAFIVYKHNVLYMYCPEYEGGGDLFQKIYGYLLTGLNFGNATVMAYFILKEAFIQFVLMIPLFAVVEGFRKYTATNYLRRLQGISREDAVKIDVQFTSQQQPSHSFDKTLFSQPELNHRPLSPLNKDETSTDFEVDTASNKTSLVVADEPIEYSYGSPSTA